MAVTDPLCVLAGKYLARQARQVRLNRRGTLDDTDPEYLHDLRVATRRARAALRLLHELVPAAEALRADLAALGRLAGEARDLDVFLVRSRARLAEAHAPTAVREVLLAAVDAERRASRGALAPVLAWPTLGPLLERLRTACPLRRRAVRRGSPLAVTDLPGSAAALGPPLVAGALRRLGRWRRREPGSLAPVELHLLRIAGKRVRYALELFAPVLAADVKPAVRRFVELQDCLGLHQDAVVAQQRLAALAREVTRTPRELLALGKAIGLERRAQAAQRTCFVAMAPELWQLVEELQHAFAARPPGGSLPSGPSEAGAAQLDEEGVDSGRVVRALGQR